MSRRLALAALALPALQCCAAPLPALRTTAISPDARALLDASAAAHGFAAMHNISDLSVSYAGAWRPILPSLQPALVDAGYRGVSQERLLLQENMIAQAHSGPQGEKHVVRRAMPGSRGDITVWYDGNETHDADSRHAAALVADGYALFLLGPMRLEGQLRSGALVAMEIADPETIVVGGVAYACDVLRALIAPGLGLSASDELMLFIDRAERLTRRVRFTLDGLDSTRGAIAEVDAFDHVALHGVRWPTGFHEQLLRPLPLPVHDWRLTGLDVNRGMSVADLSGAAFAGKAAAPAGEIDPTAGG